MSKTSSPFLFAALTALGCALITQPLAAQPAGDEDDAYTAPDEEAIEQASVRFRRGVEFYRNGDYQAALVEFQRAYEIAPNYALLYNLGQTSFELKDYPTALASFTRYLEEGGAKIKPKRRIVVDGEIAKLRNYVARISLTVEEGAEVVVDDKVIGISPLSEDILVSAGRRKISVTKAGYAPLQRIIEVAGGETKELELKLSPLQAVPPPPPPPPPPAPIRRPDTSIGAGVWIGVGLTVALGAAASVVGGLALKAKSDFDNQLNTFPTTQSDIDGAAKKVKNLANATDGLFAATGVAGVITIVALAVDLDGGGDGSATTGSNELLRPRLRLTVSPTSLGLSGTF